MSIPVRVIEVRPDDGHYQVEAKISLTWRRLEQRVRCAG